METTQASNFLSSLNLDHKAVHFLSKNGLLENLVSTWLLSKKLDSVSVDESIFSQLSDSYLSANQLTESAKLDSFCSYHCLSREDLPFVISKQYRLKAYLNQEFSNVVPRKFLDLKDQLSKAVYLLIRLEDQNFSRELYLQISEGELEFGEASSLYSRGPERLTRGMVGPVLLNQIHPLLASALRKAKPNAVLPPIKIDNDWVIVSLVNLLSPTLDESTVAKISTSLLQEQLEAETRIVIQALSSMFRQ